MKSPKIPGTLALSLWIAAACSEPAPVEIPFAVRFGESEIACGREAEGLALTDLRFYVHDLRLVDGDGRERTLQLASRPVWQGSQVAMLDLEDGSDSCSNGTGQRNAVVRGAARGGDHVGLRFRLGVPETLNHENPLLAEAPLDDAAMHWHWKSGYKFLRAGVAGSTDGYWLHLGSARCEGTIHDIRGCRSPNRPEVDLPGYVPGEHVVVLDLRELFAGVDLSDGAPSDCSSGPAEASCAGPLRALGLDGEGATAGPPVFRLERR